MKVIGIIWSERAIESLKDIFQFYKSKSLQGAINVRKDILKTIKNIVFADQYQVDDINLKYRRIIVRDFKILYLAKKDRIEIIDIVNVKRSPSFIENL